MSEAPLIDLTSFQTLDPAAQASLIRQLVGLHAQADEPRVSLLELLSERSLPIQTPGFNAEEARHYGIILDTETTGMDMNHDRIIDLSVLRFHFSATGEFQTDTKILHYRQDPGIPIPEESTRIHGINQEMVEGCEINHAALEADIGNPHIVIAHNAGYDRVFCERFNPIFRDMFWECSAFGINWEEFDQKSSKLFHLNTALGYGYSQHSATSDTIAVANILSHPVRHPDGTTENPLKILIDHLKTPTYYIWAGQHVPYDKNQLLKDIDFRWTDDPSTGRKGWWKKTKTPKEDMEYLSQVLTPHVFSKIQIRHIKAKDLYSNRELTTDA